MQCHVDVALVQEQDSFTEGLQTQLVKLRQEKDASDRALQSKHGHFERAQNVANAALTSLSEVRTRREKLQQELRLFKETLAEAHISKVNAIQVSTAT